MSGAVALALGLIFMLLVTSPTIEEDKEQPHIIDTTSNTTAFFVTPNATVSYIAGLRMNETHIAGVKNELTINYTHGITKATSSVTDNTANATVIFISTNGNVSYATQLSLNSNDIVFLKDLLTRDYLPTTGNTTISTNTVDE